MMASPSNPRQRRKIYATTAIKAPANDPFADRGKSFSVKLNRAMVAKGWNQSDLAPAASKFMPHGSEINRQRISSYIAKGHLPNMLALNALAKSLGLQPEDLVPPTEASFLNAPFAMQSDGMRAHVKLDLTLSLEDAMAIAAIAKKYAA